MYELVANVAIVISRKDKTNCLASCLPACLLNVLYAFGDLKCV